jgi:branched-subunit amino acid aminotransferase/4-amino-4-deoxychorismate lyase
MSTGASDFTPWLGVFETLRVIKGTPLFVPEHRAELARAMEALGLKSEFDFEHALAALPPQSGRLRWVVTADTTHALFSQEDAPSTEPVALSVSPVRLGSGNWDARFKTLSYLSHAQALKTAATPEVILLNEHGHVASAARANLFWRRGDKLFTPAHEAGCRCGVTRAFVLAHHQAEQGHFPLDHLLHADEILLTNSLKGIVSVNELPDRKRNVFLIADNLRAIYAKAVQAQLK